MDFNTRPSGAGGGARPPGGTGTVPGGPGDDYNLSDPVGSFVRTALGVLLSPVAFFRGLRRSGNFLSPIVFVVICAVISGLLGGILNLIFPPEVPAELEGVAGAQTGVGIGSLLGSLVLTPIVILILLFIGSGIAHILVALLVQPTNSGFEATMRVGAYTYALLLINWLGGLPFIGWLISLLVFIYTLFLWVVGIREVHSTTTGRAVVVVAIPVGIALVFLLILAALIGAAIWTVLQQQ